MEKRLGYLIGQFHAAAQDFESSLAIDTGKLDPAVADAVRNGQAQKFEFTIELFWKTVRAFLLDLHGFDLASPKSVVKKYFELGYCSYEDCERLLLALDIRNSLSHVYKKDSFEALHREITGYRIFFLLSRARFVTRADVHTWELKARFGQEDGGDRVRRVVPKAMDERWRGGRDLR